MNAKPVIAVFDIGKTNKKLFLFDEQYKIVYETSTRIVEAIDEDGFACESLESLRRWVFDTLNTIFSIKEFTIKAVTFSAYGASLVNLDENGNPVTPLYNYLKPYPDALSQQLYKKYGGEDIFSIITASPLLGSLNAGLQLYRLKVQQPQLFKRIKQALHLPQYLSFLLTGQYYSDMTSIGCHTALWDFERNQYHGWVKREGIDLIQAPILSSDTVLPAVFMETKYKAGIGLHDSSAALIPYLVSFNEPFILLSTGTWCISLNPFDLSPLTPHELASDCLCYMQYQGTPVKAARLFSGFEHEQQVKRIAEHFAQDALKYLDIHFDFNLIAELRKREDKTHLAEHPKASRFSGRDLSGFKNDVEAYHQLIMDLVEVQVISTSLVLKSATVKRIFVDGGFSKNTVFMHVLAAAFPGIEVFAASMAQASAIGAALSIHKEWNTTPIPKNIIQLNYYSSK